MKTLADLVLLGDPRLYEVYEPVTETIQLEQKAEDLLSN